MATIIKNPLNTWKASLGAYSLAVITPDLIARYRGQHLEAGKAANTVHLELSLRSHLFTIAIKEWRVGLFYSLSGNVASRPRGKAETEGCVQMRYTVIREFLEGIPASPKLT